MPAISKFDTMSKDLFQFLLEFAGTSQSMTLYRLSTCLSLSPADLSSDLLAS